MQSTLSLFDTKNRCVIFTRDGGRMYIKALCTALIEHRHLKCKDFVSFESFLSFTLHKYKRIKVIRRIIFTKIFRDFLLFEKRDRHKQT